MEIEKITVKNKHGQGIVGILTRKTQLDTVWPKPRLIIIAHGVLGHKDYLFQRLMSEKLPYTTFRLDFRGNGESEGLAGYANMEEDAEDISTVASHFEQLGYEIFGTIGHSRGSLACLQYAANRSKPIPHCVNISGRYKMNDNQIHRNRPEIGEGLKRQGYFNWTVRQRDKITTIKVTEKEVNKFINWDNSYVAQIPRLTSVLTCHGLKDEIVPHYNATMFSDQIKNHTLVLLPDADHNYRGQFEQVVKVVTTYFDNHENIVKITGCIYGKNIDSANTRRPGL
ncbi:Alpha/Beta hydrolase protein [Phycomyces nitens]|nr:Alpha/Beta hydrolase protein [Phycomyces nitens]